jgi:hypothetical protein
MPARVIHHRAVIPGALCVAAALGWALVQTRQDDPSESSQPTNPRVSSRDRPQRDSSTLPSRAEHQSPQRLRAWAAAMTDTELLAMARRLVDQIPADETEPDGSLKSLLCEVFREWGRREVAEGTRPVDWNEINVAVHKLTVGRPGAVHCHYLYSVI